MESDQRRRGQRDLRGPRSLASLTEKQREVLDLLLEHKTSKQIARQLRISPHTVDQRIQFAKYKLGARTRSEAAVAYRRLLETCERMTYENLGLAPERSDEDDTGEANASIEELSPPNWTGSDSGREVAADYQVGQGMFDGRHGTLVRLGAIIAIAVLIVLLVSGALATLVQLSQLMQR
jgi:DNA-binding CsgD family transcriptional regulator